MQMEFVTELFRLAKDKGVHTTLDTAGHPFTREETWLACFRPLYDLTDLFLLDIKHIDPEKHRRLTGVGNENILDFARYIAEHGGHMWIRHVLVPGYTDDEGDLSALRAFIDSLRGISPTAVERVEVLPYHTLGVPKYEKLGIAYRLAGVPAPTADAVERAKKILCE